RQAVAAPVNQIDRRRCEKRELLRIDGALEVDGAAIEEHDDIEDVAGRRLEGRSKPGYRHEVISLREREIFVQQAIALERSRLVRKERLRLVESLRHDGVGRAKRAPFHRAFDTADENSAGTPEQQFVETRSNVVGPGKKERQAIERKTRERHATGCA